MKKARFHIAVAVFAGMLFLAVTVSHACIGTTAPHGSHDHSGIQAAGLQLASHSEAPDAGCTSIRDHLLSLAPERSSHAIHLTSGLLSMLTFVRLASINVDTASAEGRAGCAGIQPRPYFFKSVLRI